MCWSFYWLFLYKIRCSWCMSIYKPPSCHICYTVLFYLRLCCSVYLFCRLFLNFCLFFWLFLLVLLMYVSVIHFLGLLVSILEFWFCCCFSLSAYLSCRDYLSDFSFSWTCSTAFVKISLITDLYICLVSRFIYLLSCFVAFKYKICFFLTPLLQRLL